MLILKNKEGQLVFYDICRQKFVAQCEINNISSYGIVDDCLIIGVEKQQKILNTMVQSIEEEKVQIEYKKITLPFCQTARDGDFLFYTAFDSVFPNPLASIKDLAPANTLEELKEFAIYPSCWSLPHHAAALLDRSAISRIFNEEFQCLTNSFGENMFTLAVERGDPEITNEVLKSFSQFS